MFSFQINCTCTLKFCFHFSLKKKNSSVFMNETLFREATVYTQLCFDPFTSKMASKWLRLWQKKSNQWNRFDKHNGFVQKCSEFVFSKQNFNFSFSIKALNEKHNFATARVGCCLWSKTARFYKVSCPWQRWNLVTDFEKRYFIFLTRISLRISNFIFISWRKKFNDTDLF